MRILGLSGGIASQRQADPFNLGKVLFHDAAAALVDGGRVVFAVEEERLNRIKHTNKAPLEAVRACLRAAGLAMADIDYIAYYADDHSLTAALQGRGLGEQDGAGSFAEALRLALQTGLDCEIDARTLRFVRHHMAHAMSAFMCSGFDDSLVYTVDAMGEDESALLLDAAGRSVEILRSIPISQSLGFMYADLINFIGFEYQEEYKVMGLAPYGDPARFRPAFAQTYELLPAGAYRLKRERFKDLAALVPKRSRAQSIGQDHMDFAAALQGALEEIVFHILAHFRSATGRRNLCLAGGVAQNCSLNGRLAYSGLFDRVFVQPASTDAGCAIGAALEVSRQLSPGVAAQRLEHVYLGKDLGDSAEVLASVRPWSRLLRFRRLPDPCQEAAELLAAGRVIGWMQGRAEFGPRALGNRSILADPRPADNRERINALVKKREAFRPFAPAVLDEAAPEYFDWPSGVANLGFMTFVVSVREEKRALLGAVTHIDGTARAQTVTRSTNPLFWTLIERFGWLTGVPVLLNTSFNNNCEPIVDSVTDGIVCLMTTGLDALVVSDWLVEVDGEIQPGAFLDLVPALPAHLRLVRGAESGQPLITSNVEMSHRVALSHAMAGVLMAADGRTSLRELAVRLGCTDRMESIIAEARELWTNRTISLLPV